jgi:hypothetical protein
MITFATGTRLPVLPARSRSLAWNLVISPGLAYQTLHIVWVLASHYCVCQMPPASGAVMTTAALTTSRLRNSPLGKWVVSRCQRPFFLLSVPKTRRH